MAQQHLNEIANIRTRQGLSRAQLAAASRVPADKLAKFEAGTAHITLDYAMRIAMALRVTVPELAKRPAPVAPVAQPVYVAPARSEDAIQAEIDDLEAAKLLIECKDRWSAADGAEFSRLTAAISAAYARMEQRDAGECAA